MDLLPGEIDRRARQQSTGAVLDRDVDAPAELGLCEYRAAQNERQHQTHREAGTSNLHGSLASLSEDLLLTARTETDCITLDTQRVVRATRESCNHQNFEIPRHFA